MHHAKQEVILLAATGMSPAVLTETIWALAHEDEPIVPDRVVVLTTARGRDVLVGALLEPSVAHGDITVWDDLRAALHAAGRDVEGKLQFGASGNDIRVFTAYDRQSERSVELDDIRSLSDNEAVADFVLETVRAVVENPDTRLIASVAGGRKTVGILIYASMMLIGCEDDRLVHVLVNPPFDDSGLDPPFYFPAQSATPARLRGSSVELLPQDARIELADIPFVPLRNRFRSGFGRAPGRFTALVGACREEVNRSAAAGITLRVWRSRKMIAIEGSEIELGPREQLIMLFLAGRAHDGAAAIDSYVKAEPLLEEFRLELRAAVAGEVLPDWRYDIGSRLESREITHAVSEIRSKLRRHGSEAHTLVNCLPARGRFSLDLPSAQIEIVD